MNWFLVGGGTVAAIIAGLWLWLRGRKGGAGAVSERTVQRLEREVEDAKQAADNAHERAEDAKAADADLADRGPGHDGDRSTSDRVDGLAGRRR